jgi:probable phosphoglycerate mutase
MQGRYKVKSPELKPLYERAAKMAKQIPYFTIEHVRREYNTDADALANVALDSAGVPKFERGAEKTAAARPAASAPAPEKPRIFRGRVTNGTLELSGHIDLPEGSEIEVAIRIINKK